MAETWVLNETIPMYNIGFQTNFTSNGQDYDLFTITEYKDAIPYYTVVRYRQGTTIIKTVYNANNSPAWVDEAYRTVTFQTDPTGSLLTWLQANATQQFLCGANDMYAVADAIRTKAGSTAALAFPDGFVTAVNGIQTGGGGGGVVWYESHLE